MDIHSITINGIDTFYSDVSDSTGSYFAISVPNHLTPNDLSKEIATYSENGQLFLGKMISFIEPRKLDNNWYIIAYYSRS